MQAPGIVMLENVFLAVVALVLLVLVGVRGRRLGRAFALALLGFVLLLIAQMIFIGEFFVYDMIGFGVDETVDLAVSIGGVVVQAAAFVLLGVAFMRVATTPGAMSTAGTAPSLGVPASGPTTGSFPNPTVGPTTGAFSSPDQGYATQGYAAQGYAAQGYAPAQGSGAPAGYAPPGAGPSLNTMAILALVFAFVIAPLGIVFGVIGRNQIRRTGEGGRGLATAGMVIGIVFTVLGVIGWVVVGITLASGGPSF